MTSGTRDPFYSSPAWLAVRRQALIRDQYRCTVCHRDVHKKGESRVDHIKAKRDFPHLALVLANLRTLCKSCDNKRHAEKGGREVHGIASDGTPLDPAHPWNAPAHPYFAPTREHAYSPPDPDPEPVRGHGGSFDGAGASGNWDASPSSSEPQECRREDYADTSSSTDTDSMD